MTRQSLASLLDDMARLDRRPALVEVRGLRTERVSYGELRRRALGAAAALDRKGVGRGERVILRAGAGADWIAAFLGCLARGAVVVPLDVEGPPGFAEEVARQVRPRLSLDGQALRALIAAAPPAAVAPPPPGAGDLAEIVFTSGTTGAPRGVCLTHANLLANLAPVEAEAAKHTVLARLFGPLRLLAALPLTHVFGQVACVLAPPLLGAEVVLPEDLQARELAYRSRRHRVSFVVGVPRQLELLREHVLREAERRGQARDLARLVEASAARGFIRRRFASRRWRRLVGRRLLGFACGGAALPGPVEEFWRRLGFVVMQGYGMTETAALVSLQNPLASKPGSIGKPLPGQEVKVGAGGEILVRGASVAAGYWDGGLRPLTDAEGWLATGDLAERDPEGHLFFRGRSKDMIVTAAGLNVYPADLEAALDAQPEVKASAVVPFEGPAGPEPVAVVILEAGEGDPEARARASLERANARLAQHQRMRRVVIWPESDFPRTGGLRKVKKSEVEAALAAREKAAPGEAGPIRGELQRVLRSVGADPEAASEARAALLADLKLDSLGQVELVSALEERFGVELDEAAVTPATTVEDLERLVAGGTAPAPAYPYPAWAQWPPWTTLRRVLQAALVVPLTRLLGSPSIAGRERLRGLEGPALFICNHVTMVDPALVLVALPRGVRLAVAMEGERLRGYRRPPAGARPGAFLGPLVYALLVLLFNTFPLPRRSGFRRSLQFASERVEEGQSLLIFPEGRRTPDGALHRFFPGTGLLAARLGLPVVPLRILGLFEVRRRRPPFARPGEVKVVVGEPVRYGAEDTAEAIASDLERRVGELG